MHTHCSDAQILLHYLLAGLQWQFADCNVPECMRALGYTYKLQHARCTLFRIVACLTAKLPQSAAILCGTQTVLPATTWGMQIMMLYAISHTMAHHSILNLCYSCRHTSCSSHQVVLCWLQWLPLAQNPI